MASQRTTFDKLQRERAKRAKQALKREKRHDRSGSESGGDDFGGSSTDNPADLLAQIAALHEAFDDKQIDFETFEERKTELFERLAALPIDG